MIIFFFFGWLSLFCFNWASLFNKNIWVNLYKFIFSIPPLFYSQPNKNKGNNNLFYPPTFLPSNYFLSSHFSIYSTERTSLQNNQTPLIFLMQFTLSQDQEGLYRDRMPISYSLKVVSAEVYPPSHLTLIKDHPIMQSNKSSPLQPWRWARAKSPHVSWGDGMLSKSLHDCMGKH